MDTGQALSLEPLLWLGAPSEGGFLVPDAKATQSSMYGPRGVFYDGKHLIVADTGNHRVLIWFSFPDRDHAPADVVLGQRDFFSDSPNAGGDTTVGMYMPCGVWVKEGMLFVADSWNHRVLVWEEIPTECGKKPDIVVGQDSLLETEPTKGENSPANGFFWCYGVGFSGDTFFVCDTGNRRVLGWESIPEGRKEADIVLEGFGWAHAVAGNGGMTFVADAGKHRVLGWKGVPDADTEPCVILGQESLREAVDWTGMPQNERTLRFPYGVSLTDRFLAVADTTNNRVLLWTPVPREGAFLPACGVVGQDSFQEVGENKLKGVYKDTLCWSYGVHLWEDLVFVADTGNNRITVWKLRECI